jgi:hypothetical protein
MKTKGRDVEFMKKVVKPFIDENAVCEGTKFVGNM